MAEQPVIVDGVRLGELVAIFALGQDNAFGQPLESQMRSTLLAAWLAESMGLPADVRDVVYWVGQLRYIGCTGHAHEVAVLFGDEIETRARTLLYDAANPSEVLRDVLGHAMPARRGLSRIGAMVSLLAGGRTFAEMNFRTGCEVADVIAGRLGMSETVREALSCTFERWNGKGQPNGVKGEQIPLGMRMVHLTHDMEVLARLRSPGTAALAARRRSGSAYDPALVTEFLGVADELFDRLGKLDPWDEVLALEPAPHRVLRVRPWTPLWRLPLTSSISSPPTPPGTRAGSQGLPPPHANEPASRKTRSWRRDGPASSTTSGARRSPTRSGTSQRR